MRSQISLVLLLLPLLALSQAANPVVPTTTPLISGLPVVSSSRSFTAGVTTTTTTPLIPRVVVETETVTKESTTSTTPVTTPAALTTTPPPVLAIPNTSTNTNTKATTVWVTDAAGSVTPSIYSQPFAANGIASPPRIGVIGMGTQTGEIGVVRTHAADASRAVRHSPISAWCIALVVGASGVFWDGMVVI